MKNKPNNTFIKHKRAPFVTAVAADEEGRIFDLEGYAAVGMSGPVLSPLTEKETVPLPHGSELMLMPDRNPILYNMETGSFEVLEENPYVPGEKIFPVAAFNSPGYVLSAVSAYKEETAADVLPLFSYGAVGWHKGGFWSAAILVDKEPRQDLRQMPHEKVVSGVSHMRRQLPDNRLSRHLEKCALTYGCPAGKNFFLGRYEAPLPASNQCNARCLGCISKQSGSTITSSQDRISFTPSPEEIAQVALTHIKRVKKAVVSFGQGCEGDPLLAADVIEPAIRLIRQETSAGTINMNTNGSLPKVLDKLFQAGLDSIRVSMNSVRKACYTAYFRPRGYTFDDVKKGIDIARSHGRHVAVNYLNCPGFTDTPEEKDALLSFMDSHPIDFIQWRNLNFDPLQYLSIMEKAETNGKPIGVWRLLKEIKKAHPHVKYGYFNPPKEQFTKTGNVK